MAQTHIGHRGGGPRQRVRDHNFTLASCQVNKEQDTVVDMDWEIEVAEEITKFE